MKKIAKIVWLQLARILVGLAAMLVMSVAIALAWRATCALVRVFSPEAPAQEAGVWLIAGVLVIFMAWGTGSLFFSESRD